jgi:dTMP kinase
MLIVYEGIDGSGKTTSSIALQRNLQKHGVPVSVVQWTSFQMYPDEIENALFLAAERRRTAGKLGPLSYSVWHCADFAYRLETFVVPALARGEIVIMDRYKYTAYVRDVIRGLDEQVVRSLYTFAPEPDLLIYMDVDPAEAYARKKAAGTPIGFYECGQDLFGTLDEQSGFLAFQGLCRRRYDTVLAKVPALRLDASRPAAVLNGEILTTVQAKLA